MVTTVAAWVHSRRAGPPGASATANMDPNHHHPHYQSQRESPSQLEASHVKYHLPYFTPEEVQYMSERQRGKLSTAQEEKQRQAACGFIDAVGSRIGL